MAWYPRVRDQYKTIDPTGTYAGVFAITGVDVTGATDVATSAQAQVDAAAAFGVQTIWWPRGTYLTSTALLPANGQTWDGPGVLKASAGNSTAVVALNNKTDVTLRVAIDGGMTTVLTGNPGAGLVNDRYGVNIYGGAERNLITSRIQNVPGPAVRILDSPRNVIRPNIFNAYYGVTIGSAGTVNAPSGGSHYNVVEHGTIRTVAKNGIFLVGDTSGTNPNTQIGNRFTGLTISKVGDTGIEIGLGTSGTSATGLVIDATEGDGTWVGGYNGILVRDGENVSIGMFSIRNFPSFTNGSGSYLTLGNGIYVWPLVTGNNRGISIGPGSIKNCTRGVFVQGNQHTSANSGFTGNYGSAGVVYAGCTISGVAVDGTQLGTLEGSWASVQNTIFSHGFYIQSISGWTISGCTAVNCQNDGFRIGDINTQAAYVIDVSLSNCRALNNGAQAVSGQTYAGFNINGTSNQFRVSLNNCHATETRGSGSRTQHYGFRWNASGEIPALTGCRSAGHTTGYTNSGTGANFTGIGTDIKGATGGTVTSQSGAYTVTQDISTVIWTGSVTATVTLPSASVSGAARQVRVRNAGSASVTVAATAGTVALASVAIGAEYVYISDGTNWV